MIFFQINYFKRPLLKPTLRDFKKNTHPPLTFDLLIGQYWLMVHFVDQEVSFQNHYRNLGLSLVFTYLHNKYYWVWWYTPLPALTHPTFFNKKNFWAIYKFAFSGVLNTTATKIPHPQILRKTYTSSSFWYTHPPILVNGSYCRPRSLLSESL